MPAVQAWYRRNPRRSPIGLLALVLGIVSAAGFVRLVIPQVLSSRLLENSDRLVLWAIVGSGVAILLSLVSLAIEPATVPAALALLILIVAENLLFPMVLFWTPMLLGNWSWLLPIGWVLAFLAAFSLALFRGFRAVLNPAVTPPELSAKL